jgi:plasmid stabilization system protein ParE
MSFRITPEAREDLRQAFLYYESERDGLGMEFAIEVGIGLATVQDAPRRWPQIETGVHKYRIDRFPYGILYRVTGQHAIEVIAVFDLRRKPGSWKR